MPWLIKMHYFTLFSCCFYALPAFRINPTENAVKMAMNLSLVVFKMPIWFA